jgi:hypothetical protein
LQPPATLKRSRRPSNSPPDSSLSLAPVSEKKEEEKRVLRSQDTSRKSEYEDWFDGLKDEFNYDVKMLVEFAVSSIANGSVPGSPSIVSSNPSPINSLTNGLSSKPLPENLQEEPTIVKLRNQPIEIIDLEGELLKSHVQYSEPLSDPLDDELYFAPHRAEERREKRIRNIERDQLAHNAQRIEQDLEKLHNPDWIKSIGLSNLVVARCSRKELDARKERLMTHLEGILEKHKAWKEDERRKKLSRYSGSPSDRATVELEDHTPRDYSTTWEGDDSDSSYDATHLDTLQRPARRPSSRRRSPLAKKPALPRSVPKIRKSSPKPEAEFTSFYDKPYKRQQALNRWRKSSRTPQTAFGEPLPVLKEKDFELPIEIASSAIAFREARVRKMMSL